MITSSHKHAQALPFTLTSESVGRRQNSVVVMFTDKGLMLNLVKRQISRYISRVGVFHHMATSAPVTMQ